MMNFKPTQKNQLMLLAVEVSVKVEMCKIKRISSLSLLSKVIPSFRVLGQRGIITGGVLVFLGENLAFLQGKQVEWIVAFAFLFFHHNFTHQLLPSPPFFFFLSFTRQLSVKKLSLLRNLSDIKILSEAKESTQRQCLCIKEAKLAESKKFCAKEKKKFFLVE